MEEVEGYELMQNEEGEILIILNAGSIEPDNPRFVYDGGDTMIYYSNPQESFTLSVEEQVREILNNLDQLLVVEVAEDSSTNEFTAPIRHVKSLKAFL